LISTTFFAEAGNVYFIGSKVEVESVDYGLFGLYGAQVFTLKFNRTIYDPSILSGTVLSGKKTSHCAKKLIAPIRNRPGRYKLILTNGREYEIQLVEQNKKVILFYLEGTDPKDRKTVKMKTVKSTDSPTSKYDELKKLKELLDQGIITQAEFDTEKKKILERDN